MQFIVMCAFLLAVAESAFGHQCGSVASGNIVHQAPWLVLLEYYRRGVQHDTRCGGTLISRRHVVTAAHCVKNMRHIQMVTRLGDYDLDTTTDCVEGVCSDEAVRLPVVEAFVHPGYDLKEHDIAILKLGKDAPYTDFIRPICPPTGKVNENTTFLASGWGEISRGIYSQTAKRIALSFFPTDQCRDAYPTVSLPNNIICAGGEKNKDTCRGDSGGPLALTRDKVELWGVISSGNTECGTEGKPGIYTSVIDHLEWIRMVVSQSG
ncbi:CLIP domain-containing serine protease B9-like [Plodia interpunctella]|uniref:CLIP domain-containing serine protease B9-like n=1 Tax=Plodia interpunctella TaxID=58824 RepID=UPI00236744E2|nr:CLIP domain-containing serine protease B9-like [Plodia interpunctella]